MPIKAVEMTITRGMGKEDVAMYIYIYTREYYSVIKKKEVMPSAAT